MESTATEIRAGVHYRGIEVAPSSELLEDAIRFDLWAIKSPDAQGSSAGDARRAMERIASAHAAMPIRVATLTPSGRPIALQNGDRANVQVSASHAAGMVVATCRIGRRGIGVDLVDPSLAGRGLDWWADEIGASGKCKVDRARLWAARESAYKAAMSDVPFVPAKVEVEMIDGDGFRWRINVPTGSVRGWGRFYSLDHCLLAVAAEERSITSERTTKETTSCL